MVAGAGNVNIDDTTPQVSWNNPASGWTSQTSETLDVTVGPSGLSSLNCTDNGERSHSGAELRKHKRIRHDRVDDSDTSDGRQRRQLHRHQRRRQRRSDGERQRNV